MTQRTAAVFGTTKPITGQDIALEVLQCLGYRYVLRRAFVVTYTLQDYEFGMHRLLSTLLHRHTALGADITVLTTPPPGKGTKAAFKRKLDLLTDFVRDGITVFVNENLHAKAYIFLDERGVETTIVGSANLTSRGVGVPHSPESNLIEMALVTWDTGVYNAVVRIIENEFLNDRKTTDFATWSALNIGKIAKARGGP